MPTHILYIYALLHCCESQFVSVSLGGGLARPPPPYKDTHEHNFCFLFFFFYLSPSFFSLYPLHSHLPLIPYSLTLLTCFAAVVQIAAGMILGIRNNYDDMVVYIKNNLASRQLAFEEWCDERNSTRCAYIGYSVVHYGPICSSGLAFTCFLRLGAEIQQ
jgi:hypothetical protein